MTGQVACGGITGLCPGLVGGGGKGDVAQSIIHY